MSNKLVHILFFWTLLLLSNYTFAQEDWEEQGEIEQAQIVVEKNKKIELPRANRKFEKIDNIEEKSVNTTQDFEDLTPSVINLEQISPRLKVLKIKAEKPKEFLGNYVEAGFGNYVTPYLNAHLNSTRNSNYAYGINVNHISSKNGPVDYSGMSSSRVGVNGDYFLNKNTTVSGKLNYGNETFRYYGFNADDVIITDEKDITQSLNEISSSIGIRGVTEKINYNIDGIFSTLSGKNDLSDLNYGYKSKVNYTLADKSSIQVNSDLIMENANNNSINVSRTYFSLNPSYKFLHDGIHVTMGLNSYYHNDQTGGFHLYPHIFLNYPLFVNELNVFGGVTGGIERNSFNSLLNENLWYLMDTSLIFNNNNTINFFGGVKGNFSQKLGYRATISYKNYKNLHFFINNPLDSTHFIITTDTGNTTVFTFSGELDYEVSKKITSSLSLELNKYSLSKLKEAYHRPSIILGANITYNVQDKVFLKSQLNIVGGLKSMSSTNETIELNSIIDLNFGLDYKISNNFYSFVMLNNVLNSNYQHYYNYQSKGFNAILGVSYSF